MKQEFTIQPEALYTFTPHTFPFDLDVGDFCVGRVLFYKANTRSLWVELENGSIGIIHEDDITIYKYTYPHCVDTLIPYQISSLVGKLICARVKSKDSVTGHYILSRKDVLLETYNYLLECPNTILQSYITNIISYGIFLDIGNGLIAFLHVTECSRCRYSDLTKHFSKGDLIPVKVISILSPEENFKIDVSRKQASPSLSDNPCLFSVGDITSVKFCQPTPVNDGYYVELTPAIAGIIDLLPDVTFTEGLHASAVIKKITPKGLRLNVIELL